MNERVKDIAKLLLSLFYYVLARLPQRLVGRPVVLPVFNYHAVEAGQAPRFARQVRFLARRWRFVSLEEIAPALEGGRHERAVAHLCFDDALQSVADHALPVLAEMNVPCTVLVPTSLVGGTMVPPGEPAPLMTWDTIRRLSGPLVRFQSHTATHRLLTQLPDDEVRRELLDSRRELEERLGRPVMCVCYPRGRCDERVKKLARASGYRLGLSTLTHSDRSDDPMDVHRILLRPSFSLLEIWLMTQGAYNWLAALEKLRRRRRARDATPT